jgi:hypothetical protein
LHLGALDEEVVLPLAVVPDDVVAWVPWKR